MTVAGESDISAARCQIREALRRGGSGNEVSFKVVQAGFTPQFCQLLAVWPWASYGSPKPPLFICEMRLGIEFIAQGARETGF